MTFVQPSFRSPKFLHAFGRLTETKLVRDPQSNRFLRAIAYIRLPSSDTQGLG